MFGSQPEFVMGLGSLDILKDGRDVYDNIQLIYKYPNGQKMTYSSISTNQLPAVFQREPGGDGRNHHGHGRHHRTHRGGDDPGVTFQPPIAWWYREPPKAAAETTKADEEEGSFRRGRHHGGNGRRQRPRSRS